MNRSLSGLAATVLLTMFVQAGCAAEAVHVAATSPAAASANLIARADRALRDYVAACSSGDNEAFARSVTSDAVVEYYRPALLPRAHPFTPGDEVHSF